MPEHNAHILAIEISNPGAGVRIGPTGQTSGPGVALGRRTSTSIEPIDTEWLAPPIAGRFGGHDDDLMPAIARLFARTKLTPRECLSAVAVSIGPGGYTSLRIACAAAKMIAEAAGAKCIAIPTAHALALGVPHDRWSRPVAIALASKGDTAWLQVFDGPDAPQGEGRVLTSAEAAPVLDRAATLIADTHLPAAMRAHAQAHNITILEPIYSPLSILAAAASHAELDPALCNPLYPREPDAVTLWRKRAEPLA